MRRTLLTTASLLALVAVSGCARPMLAPISTMTGATGEPRADMNPTNPNGRMEIPDIKTPGLQDIQSMRAPREAAKPDPAAEMKLTALRDAAQRYGVQGGLAFAAREINRTLQANAANLSRTYDFNRLLIKKAGGVTLLPPVISESRDTYEQGDAGKTLRVADRYYEIISQARFAPTAPLWHSYLVMAVQPPDRHPEPLPSTDAEARAWSTYVAEGWETGVAQAKEDFKLRQARLVRDFTGMVRYAELLERGEVSEPVVAGQNLGVTGTGQDMRQNDRVFRITKDPRLNVREPRGYRAPVSGMTPGEAATPPGRTPARHDPE